jgi:hypothetical protein
MRAKATRMKFLANLFGTQSADAKTLDQSRAQLASAKTSAEQVAALFTTAGIDLDALLAAGPDALKTHIAEVSASVLQTVKATYDAAIQASAAVETKLRGELATATNATTTILAALSENGVKPEAGKPIAEALPAALTARISVKARELLAATGGPLLDDVAAADATKPGAKTDPQLTGQAKVRAYFKAQAAKNN